MQWEGYNEQTWEPLCEIKHTDAYKAWFDAEQNRRRLQVIRRQWARRTPSQIARDSEIEEMDPFEDMD